VHDVTPERGYTFTMISREPGNDQTGKISLEPLGPNRTLFSFEERYHLTKAPWKWFEGYIYKFINKKNEESMRAAAQYLTDHPEFRPDLIEKEEPAEQAEASDRGAGTLRRSERGPSGPAHSAVSGELGSDRG
jgi:hypothetical protein